MNTETHPHIARVNIKGCQLKLILLKKRKERKKKKKRKEQLGNSVAIVLKKKKCYVSKSKLCYATSRVGW